MIKPYITIIILNINGVNIPTGGHIDKMNLDS